MTMLYPNDLDIYGFCPVEADAESGALVVDRNTGVCGRVAYMSGIKGVYTGGVFWAIEEEKHKECDKRWSYAD